MLLRTWLHTYGLCHDAIWSLSLRQQGAVFAALLHGLGASSCLSSFAAMSKTQGFDCFGKYSVKYRQFVDA